MLYALLAAFLTSHALIQNLNNAQAQRRAEKALVEAQMAAARREALAALEATAEAQRQFEKRKAEELAKQVNFGSYYILLYEFIV